MGEERVLDYKRKDQGTTSMSKCSNLEEFGNEDVKTEHNSYYSKPKKQKLIASSSGLRAGDDGNGSLPTHMLRSRGRVQEVVTPTSTHDNPCTVLSWLIDNNGVLPRQIVQYCSTKGGRAMTQGKVSRKGIVCNCCEATLTLGGFQRHAAGCSNHTPAANIFLEDGMSLLECQKKIMIDRRKKIPAVEQDLMEDNWPRDKNDCICTICQDGGELLLCDSCPAVFHKICIRLKDIPDGDWYCPACCCAICSCSIEPTVQHRTCGQCKRKYHTGCLMKRLDNLESDPQGNWYCSPNCQEICSCLNKRLGKQNQARDGNVTWSILKTMKSDSDDTNEPDNDVVQSYTKLNLALQVMQECFKHFKEPHTGRHLAEDIIFNKGSDVNGMNFQGFYTVLLEKDDELITVATVRIYGTKVAEVPLIGTRLHHRGRGMCRLMMTLLEKMLMELGVERLVLPIVCSARRTWNKQFGISNMIDSDRRQYLDYRFLDFEDTTMSQKRLPRTTLVKPHPSKEELLDDSGSGEDVDPASFIWKIQNFSSYGKGYSDFVLTDDLRWRMLMCQRWKNVDNLTVYLDFEGASELSPGLYRCVQFRLTVVNQFQRSKSITRVTNQMFTKNLYSCGFESLIPIEELRDHSKGYLVNDTFVLEARIAVSKAGNRILQENIAGSSTSKPVEYSIQVHKEQGPPFDIRTGGSEQVCFEFADTITDPLLVDECNDESCTSPSELMSLRGLENIDRAFVPLLEEACSWHPSLIECQKESSPGYNERAFTALARVLQFLKTKKVKDMNTHGCEELKFLWSELKAFRFELSWLAPNVDKALGKIKVVERAAKVKRLREGVSGLQNEAKILQAKIVVAETDLKKVKEEGFVEATMNNNYC